MANEITNRKPTMSAILASNGIKELANSLSLTPKQINKATGAALALSSNPNLSKCDPFSLVKYCYEIARYDFSRDDCVYPVPYYDSRTGSTKVQAQIGFRGFRELAYQSGLYSEINASVVYSDDKVRRDHETGEIVVEFSESPEAMDGAVVGYFAFAKDKQGKLISSVYMSKAKMDKHRDTYSKSKSGPWTTSYEKMALKTVIKQLCGKVAVIENGEIVERGPVAEIFARPKTKAAKKLFFPDEENREKAEARTSTKNRLRLAFDESSAYKPIIANMILETGAPVNFFYADLDMLGGEQKGQMVIGLSEDKILAEKQKEYLRKEKVEFIELNEDTEEVTK